MDCFNLCFVLEKGTRKLIEIKDNFEWRKHTHKHLELLHERVELFSGNTCVMPRIYLNL